MPWLKKQLKTAPSSTPCALLSRASSGGFSVACVSGSGAGSVAGSLAAEGLAAVGSAAAGLAGVGSAATDGFAAGAVVAQSVATAPSAVRPRWYHHEARAGYVGSWELLQLHHI